MTLADANFVIPNPRAARRGTWIPPSADLGTTLPGGQLRDRYQLLEMLGRGAHGVTYLAQHQLLNSLCVVKLVPALDAATPDTLVRRQRDEARAGYRIRHPNVVRLLDCDLVAGMWFMVMEYVDGVDLQALLSLGRPPWQQVAAIARDAAVGLRAIHERRLVHRDIKPGNLLLGADGVIRITDMGVASLVNHHSDGSEPVGTVEFAAPEVFEAGAKVDERVDLYGLGGTLYYLLTGRPPHSEFGSLTSLLTRYSDRVSWPSESATTSPTWLRELIEQLLKPNPADRPQSAEMVLERIAQHAEIAAAAPRSAAPTPQQKAAAGVAVLSLRNDGGNEADNWIGHALADGLGRALRRFPNLHVAEQEHVREIADNLKAGEALDDDAALRRAGRYVGAATLVRGWYRRVGDRLLAGLELLSEDPRLAGRCSAELAAPHADLPALQDQVVETAAGLLELAGSGPSAFRARARPLAAHRLVILAKQSYLRGRFDEAAEHAEGALALDSEYVDALQYAAAAYARVGQYDRARAYHERQELIAEQVGDIRLAVEARTNLGVMNYFRGDYEQAYSYCSRATETAEAVGLGSELANIYSNLGYTLLKLGRLDEAQRAYERAVQRHHDVGALASLIGPYVGLGNILMERESFSEASAYFRKALALAEEIGDRINVGMAQMSLGRVATQLGRYDGAKLELATALATLESTNFWNGLARVYDCMGDLNMRTANFAEAIICAERRIELARKHKNAAMERAAWLQMADALERAGRVAEAATCRARSDHAGAGTELN